MQRFGPERKKDVYSILLCLWKYNLKQRVIMYSYNSINVCKSRFKKLSSLGAGYFVSRLNCTKTEKRLNYFVKTME